MYRAIKCDEFCPFSFVFTFKIKSIFSSYGYFQVNNFLHLVVHTGTTVLE